MNGGYVLYVFIYLNLTALKLIPKDVAEGIPWRMMFSGTGSRVTYRTNDDAILIASEPVYKRQL